MPGPGLRRKRRKDAKVKKVENNTRIVTFFNFRHFAQKKTVLWVGSATQSGPESASRGGIPGYSGPEHHARR